MALDFIKPGDKIDINLLHQNNGKTYKSGVFDFIDDTELEITMPTDEGRMVMFHVGVACQLYFYTARGLYTCEAVVTNRYKKDNFYLLTAKVKSALKKFQRREYYRLECSVDFAYYKISNEVADLETTEELFEEIANPEYLESKKLARTLDLSGGGSRFATSEPLETGDMLLAVLRLTNDKIDRTFYLVADVISCCADEKIQERWIARVKWRFKNKKDRDAIIRYVFEEDRMQRKKESGE